MGGNEVEAGGKKTPHNPQNPPHPLQNQWGEVGGHRGQTEAKPHHNHKKGHTMSLAIDVDNITHVLLADGWHEVHDASFGTDSYEFVGGQGTGDSPMLEGGQEKHIPAAGHRGSTSREHIAAAGFSFTEGDHILSGPLTSVLAVKTRR
jgi:hypothetical protein